MPTTITFGQGSAYAMGFAKLSNNSVYWVQQMSVTSPNNSTVGLYGDSSGNIYTAGDRWYVIKFNSAGAIQWQTYVNGGSGSGGLLPHSQGFIVDSSGNSYMMGYNGYSTGQLFVGSYDTSGTFRYVVKHGYAIDGQFVNVPTFDNSSNILVMSSTTCSNDGNISRFNPSNGLPLTPWWNMNGKRPMGLSIDSSNNLYGMKYYCILCCGASLRQVVISKVPQSGAGCATWSKSFGTNGQTPYPQFIGCSAFASGLFSCGTNYYALSVASGLGYCGTANLQFYNSSGTSIAYVGITNGSTTSNFNQGSVFTDNTNGYVYSIWTDSISPSKAVILKHNKSGTLQWQRSISSTTKSVTGKRIWVDVTNGFMYLTTSDGTNIYIWKLPVDGSHTQTAVVNSISFTYAASSYSSGTTTYPTCSSSLNTSKVCCAPGYCCWSGTTTTGSATVVKTGLT